MGRGYYYGNRYSSYSSYKPYWRSRYSYKPASKPKPADYLDLYLKQFQYEIKSIHVYQSEPLTSLNLLAHTDLSQGVKFEQILNPSIHMSYDSWKTFRSYVEEYDCKANVREATAAERTQYGVTSAEKSWMRFVILTPEGQRKYCQANRLPVPKSGPLATPVDTANQPDAANPSKAKSKPKAKSKTPSKQTKNKATRKAPKSSQRTAKGKRKKPEAEDDYEKEEHSNEEDDHEEEEPVPAAASSTAEHEPGQEPPSSKRRTKAPKRFEDEAF